MWLINTERERKQMKISLRNDSVVVEGYVNAVDRFSRPLFEGAIGKFVERILPSVFKRALAKSRNVKVLLNHDYDRELADTASGKAKIYEDNVGLRAIVTIDDAEVVAKARAGKLVGWSFGFETLDDERATNNDGVVERTIKELDLHEVSIIDNSMIPAYIGTSIETRTVDGKTIETRVAADEEQEIVDETKETEDESGKEKPEKPAAGVTTTETNTDDDKPTEEELNRQRQLREANIAS